MYITVKDKEIYENFYDMEFKPVNINHGFPKKDLKTPLTLNSFSTHILKKRNQHKFLKKNHFRYYKSYSLFLLKQNKNKPRSMFLYQFKIQRTIDCYFLFSNSPN